MNMFKKNGGFTLVELIVVIAILAILAGVAIPVYSGYIKKAQDAAVVTELDAILTAAQAANAEKGEIDTIAVDGTTIKVTATGGFADDYDANLIMFLHGATDDAGNAVGTVNYTLNLTGTSFEGGANWTKANGWE